MREGAQDATPARVPKSLIVAPIIFVVAMSLGLRLAANANLDPVLFSRRHLATAVDMFDVGFEGNVSTWLSATLLAFLAALLAVRSMVASQRSGWVVLAVMSLALSVDEGSELHERILGVAAENIDSTFKPTFGWVIPGAVMAILLGWLGVKATRSMPPSYRRRFALAGLIFFGGALGLEVVSGEVFIRNGASSSAYVLTYHTEEAAEFAGIALALFAALRSLDVRREPSRITVRPNDT